MKGGVTSAATVHGLPTHTPNVAGVGDPAAAHVRFPFAAMAFANKLAPHAVGVDARAVAVEAFPVRGPLKVPVVVPGSVTPPAGKLIVQEPEPVMGLAPVTMI